MKQNAIPWAQLFQIAVLRFGLSPPEFWQLTFQELSYLTQTQSTDLPTQQQLQQLLRQFPDNP